MAEQSLPLNTEGEQTASRLDSILAQLDSLGTNVAEIRNDETPTLYSVPDLPTETEDSAVVADASAVAAAMAIHPPASLRLVTDEPDTPTSDESAPDTPTFVAAAEPSEPVAPPAQIIAPEPVAETVAPAPAPATPPVPDLPARVPVEASAQPQATISEGAAQDGFLADYRPGGRSSELQPTQPEVTEPRPSVKSIFGSSTLPAAATPNPLETNGRPAAGHARPSASDDPPPAPELPAVEVQEPQPTALQPPVAMPAETPMVSPFDSHGSTQPAPRFTPPDTLISQPEAVDPVSDVASEEPVKIDYFADLDNAEPVAIAGVDPKHMVTHQSEETPEPHQPSEFAATETSGSDIFPFNLDAQVGLIDSSGLLSDPLDIKNATPDALDAEYFEEAQGHGVAFPAVIAGAPAQTVNVATAAPTQMQAIAKDSADYDDELEEGPLSARLLIVSTILLAIIALAVIALDDPATVESIRASFRSLFG